MLKDDIDIWMPLYIGDYLSSTMALSTEQHGAYLLLIMHYWKSGGVMKNDYKMLSQITQLSKKKLEFMFVKNFIVFSLHNESISKVFLLF